MLRLSSKTRQYIVVIDASINAYEKAPEANTSRATLETNVHKARKTFRTHYYLCPEYDWQFDADI